jgi:hypothetical protein
VVVLIEDLPDFSLLLRVEPTAKVPRAKRLRVKEVSGTGLAVKDI